MARIFGKQALHCFGKNHFVTLISNFNWEPISRNDIVSGMKLMICHHRNKGLKMYGYTLFSSHFYEGEQLCDFLLFSLDNTALSKRGQLIKERICS